MRQQNEHIIQGTFDIPADMPVGTRLVRFTGSDPNSVAQASYVGDHTVTIDTVRTIRTTLIQGVDPLAQTFTLDASRWLGAVDIYFTQVGTQAVRVQLRTVALGMPTEVSVTEGYLTGDAIKAQCQAAPDQQQVRLTFDPVYVEAGTTMALVVLTDDPHHELAIARLGEFDPTGKAWVRAQADQAGVLLSSSNGQAWTVHQEADLKYRLLGLQFDAKHAATLTATTTFDLNPKDALMLRATTQQAAGDEQQCHFRIVAGDQTLAVPVNTLTSVPKAMASGQLEVELNGTATASPLVYPDLQLQVGQLIGQAVYVSRLITLPKRSDKIVVKFDTSKPKKLARQELQGMVTVSLQPFDHAGAMKTLWDITASLDIKGQACEATLVLDDDQTQAQAVQLQLVLQQPPDSTYRPELRNLHVVIHEN